MAFLPVPNHTISGVLGSQGFDVVSRSVKKGSSTFSNVDSFLALFLTVCAMDLVSYICSLKLVWLVLQGTHSLPQPT